MTPVPDSDYLELVGRAAYTWSYAEWTMLYTIHWLTGEDLADNVGGTGGKIVSTLARTLSAEPPEFVRDTSWEEAGEGVQGLVTANARRNDILHARPATTPGGLQCLNRWAPDHPGATGGFIKSDDLVAFAHLVEESARRLGPLFEELRRQHS